MTVTRVGDGGEASATATSIAPVLPANLKYGDTLLLVYGSNSTVNVVSTNEVWGQPIASVGFAVGGATPFLVAWKFRYAGVAPDTTLTVGGSGALRGVVIAYRDSDPTPDGVATVENGTSSTTMTFPSAASTGGVVGDMAVFLWMTQGAATNGPIGGSDPVPTEWLDDGAAILGFGYADGLMTASTATGVRTSTLSVARTSYVAVILFRQAEPPNFGLPPTVRMSV